MDQFQFALLISVLYSLGTMGKRTRVVFSFVWIVVALIELYK